MSEKLQKVLARAGLGSRREIEEWIRAGRVKVDGRVATLGERVEQGVSVQVDGRPVAVRSAVRRVIAYHKPVGEVCTRRDPDGRSTMFAALPRLRDGRWVAVGRLDVNTAGLILLTTDGELANRLMHPGSGVEREYAVRVLGAVSGDTLHRLREGVELDDGPANFATIREAGGEGANRWYHVTLKEGRKREVRRLWEAVGLRVSRLIRVRFGPLRLERELRPGKWREVTGRELDALLASAGLPPAERPSQPRRTGRPRRPRRGGAGSGGRR
ncbi:MAG: 23S rRNA pseudouridine(2605) synthase RluB [Pseudomonadota bacterium]|nr:MAG: 23S rRNA pseudouridine(2605) synthase RluB [Pseudomonadota bacterium]